MFEVTVESSATGDVYYMQVFTRLDVGKLAKTLNDAYWAESKIVPEKIEEEDE